VIGWIKKRLRDGLKEYRDPQGEDNPMACPEITIEGIDAALYAKLLAEATAAGAKFDGSQATLGGLAFDWNYDGEANVLHATCLHHPFFATCGIIEEKIRELVEKSKGAL